MTDHLTFLSWVRDGLAAAIAQPETLEAGLPVQAILDVGLALSEQPGQDSRARDSRAQDGRTVTRRLVLHGPADVQGLDPDEILRMDPPPGSGQAEPYFMPLVEFRRPDLPWLFSPVAGAEATDQKLRPWLALVVVPEEVAELSGGGERARRLTVPVRELPEPSELWAWAHAQITDLEAAESVSEILVNEPERARSRLLCPRHLEPGRRYLACLVPAFRAGAQAGLGEEVTAETLEPAWPSPATAQAGGRVDLPVFHHWRFGTGEAGDLEALIRRLTPQDLGASAVRGLFVGAPGSGVVLDGAGDELVLPMDGALLPHGQASQPWTDPAGTQFADQLSARFDHAAGAQPPEVGAPLYGGWHAGLARLSPAGSAAAATEPRWLRELNLDPRLRAYAGLGARTVEHFQDLLMESAWQQLDRIEAARQTASRTQLARALDPGLQRRLARMSPIAQLQVTRGGPQGDLGSSPVTSGAFRKLTRVNGPVSRRAGRARTPRTPGARGLAHRSVAGTITADTTPAPFGGEFFLEEVNPQLQSGFEPGTIQPFPRTLVSSSFVLDESYGAVVMYLMLGELVEAGLVSEPTFETWAELRPGEQLTSRALGSRTAVVASFHATYALAGRHHELRYRRHLPAPEQVVPAALYPADFPAAPALHPNPETGGRAGVSGRRADLAERLAGWLSAPESPGTPPAPADRAPARQVRAGLDVAALAAEVRSQLRAGSEGLGDTGTAVLAAPVFPWPMSEALREIAPDYLLPGGGVPPDSIALLQGNRGFVDSYLIGLNHAMAAELLWRGYPTDRRGTYFQQFWDRTGLAGNTTAQTPTDAAGNPVDLGALHELPPDHSLFGTPDTGEKMFLVIRGELLRRFPDLTIQVIPGRFSPGTQQLEPVPRRAPLDPQFEGRLGNDTSFFAFDLTLAEARGSDTTPGWFVAFRQAVSGLRFGLDATDSGAQIPTSLDDLAWSHVEDPSGPRGHVSVATITNSHVFAQLTEPVVGSRPVQWAANGAHMARCFARGPASILWPARDLLPPNDQEATHR